MGKRAEHAARVPRLDDFLDSELLGRAKGRPYAIQAVLDFSPQRGRIRCSFKLALVGSLDPAFQWQ
jgi:hypothetical protein